EEVQLTEAITELVKAGLGVAILARWAVSPLIHAGSVGGRSLPARAMHRVWSAVMPKDLAAADYVKEFIDLLETHAPTTRSGRPAAGAPGTGVSWGRSRTAAHRAASGLDARQLPRPAAKQPRAHH